MESKETQQLFNLMKEMISNQKESLKFQKITAKVAIKPLLQECLDKPEKRLVYDLTDGERSREQIMKLSKSGAGTISGWWIEWFSRGILEKDGAKYKKLFSLDEFGITVPSLKQTEFPIANNLNSQMPKANLIQPGQKKENEENE